MSTPDEQRPPQDSANSSVHDESTRTVTIVVPESTLRKLKIVAIMKESTVSELLADAAVAVVKRDLRKLLGKLDE